MNQLALPESSDLTPFAPGAFKTAAIFLIDKCKNVYIFVGDNYGNSKIFKILGGIRPSEEVINRIVAVASGYGAYVGLEGLYIPRPLSIMLLWKNTFRRCIEFTGGSHIISCLLSGVTIVLSLCPWFTPHNQIFPLGQVLLRITAKFFNNPEMGSEMITDNLEELLEGINGLL